MGSIASIGDSRPLHPGHVDDCFRVVGLSAGVVMGFDVGFVHGENVSSCFLGRKQATLSSSAVACGWHRSVRVSHYTARSVTLAQGSCPVCRLKPWLGQFLPVVVFLPT
jgi:hypothetical protein